MGQTMESTLERPAGRIFLAEDDEGQREELQYALEREGYQVFLAEDFGQLAQEAERLAPDLILLDIKLPGGDGLAACRQIRSRSDIPVIFITGRGSSMDELTGLTSGADDYITKPCCVPVVMARIRAVLLRSGKKEELHTLTAGGCTLNILDATVTARGTALLTRTELRILYLLFLHSGRIVSRQELLDGLWDDHIYIDDNTLSVNIARIREKLKDIGAAELIRTRRGQGYELCV